MPPQTHAADLTAPAVLFKYPDNAAVDTVIAKAHIVARSRVRGLRDRLSAEVAEIRWACKLAPISLNLAASPELQEFQVFRVTLKPGVKTIGEPLLRAIDQAVPSPIVFEVASQKHICTVAAYKRPNEADDSKDVLGEYLWGEWLAIDALRQPLPIALDIAGLYRELFRGLIPLSARPGESLKDQLARFVQVRTAERDRARLEGQLAREPQFNRKVEINRRLRETQHTLRTMRKTDD